MTTARELAEFLVGIRAADLPAQAIDHAAMLIASTLASAAYGKNIDSTKIIRALARERCGTPEATVWFDAGDKLPVTDAAQSNAIASDAAASDDSDLRNIMHAGTQLTATALAFAERTGASGEEVLVAMVAGYEAAGRIIDGITAGFNLRGFHGAHTSIFAATVAAGRLLHLDAPRMAQAIGLTATSFGGLQAAAETSTAREYHAANAVTDGINAARAAERGYIGEESILETHRGFFEIFGGVDGKEAGARAVHDLGTSWDIITDMAVKLVPGGHPYHALGEAAANAARDGDIAADDVEAIVVVRPGMERLPGPKHPKNLVDMAHSPHYFIAGAVADREFSWAHASPEKIADPVIHRLIDKIEVIPTPADANFRHGATITIRARDGRTSTSTVRVAKGAGTLGIAWSDVEHKYRTLMPFSGTSQARIDESFEVIRNFRKESGAARLVALISKP